MPPTHAPCQRLGRTVRARDPRQDGGERFRRLLVPWSATVHSRISPRSGPTHLWRGIVTCLYVPRAYLPGALSAPPLSRNFARVSRVPRMSTLEYHVLLALAGGPLHGYAVKQR